MAEQDIPSDMDWFEKYRRDDELFAHRANRRFVKARVVNSWPGLEWIAGCPADNNVFSQLGGGGGWHNSVWPSSGEDLPRFRTSARSAGRLTDVTAFSSENWLIASEKAVNALQKFDAAGLNILPISLEMGGGQECPLRYCMLDITRLIDAYNIEEMGVREKRITYPGMDPKKNIRVYVETSDGQPFRRRRWVLKDGISKDMCFFRDKIDMPSLWFSLEVARYLYDHKIKGVNFGWPDRWLADANI